MNKIFSVTYFVALPSICMAMADSTPPVYGRPTLYGEYEISSADTARASKLYGDASRVRPIRTASAKPAAKHPVKVKGAKPKKASKKKTDKKNAPAVEKKSLQTKETQPVVDVAPEKDVKAAAPVQQEKPAPVMPSPVATKIADAAANMRDVSSFCTQRKPVYKGKLPDGVILMPGRPDLMSCTDVQ